MVHLGILFALNVFKEILWQEIVLIFMGMQQMQMDMAVMRT